MKRKAAPLVLAWMFSLWCVSFGSDWTRWRGPEGTGISTEADWKPQALSSPKILWRVQLGVGHSSVAVAGKRLYTMGNRGGQDHVYCLDAESGKEIWKHSYPCDPGNYAGTRATPVLDGELLYTLSRNGHAFCLEAATGKVKWKKSLVRDFGATNIRWGFAGSPLILGDAVIYNARAHGIALDKTTGRRIWASGSGACGYATPVHFKQGEKDCVAVFGSSTVVVVDAASGRRLHAYFWRTKYDINAADPVYFDGKLFITSGYGSGCALLDLSGSTTRKIWENKSVRGHFSTPVYLNGHLYAVDGQTGSGRLRCVDVRTGKVAWTAGDNGFESLMVAGGRIIAMDKTGTLRIAQAVPTGYREIARAKVLTGRGTKWTAPVLANGLIYCREARGELACVDVR